MAVTATTSTGYVKSQCKAKNITILILSKSDRGGLRKYVNLAEDRVIFYPITQIDTWGEPPITEFSDSIIV